MKKLSAMLILASFLSANSGANFVFATPDQSQNSFEIMVSEVPPGGGGDPPSDGGGGGGGGGLSSGAVTAIALGSVFGGLAALGGIAYYFTHQGLKLTAGGVIGQSCPIKPALCGNKYVIEMKDIPINNGTFNTAYFTVPDFGNDSPVNVTVTQFSGLYTMNGKRPALDTKIFLNPSDNHPKEAGMYMSEKIPEKGYLKKNGQITNYRAKTASVVTYYDAKKAAAGSQKYSLLIEFHQ